MVKPLTKISKDGAAYVRLPAVDAALNALLVQPSSEILRSAEILDSKAQGYIRTECLVHLVREAGRRGDEASMNLLLPCIFRRTEIIVIAKFLGALSMDLVDDVIGSLGEKFADDAFSKGSNKLDFFEANFYNAVIALATTKYQKRRRHDKHFVHVSPGSEESKAVLAKDVSKEPSPLESLENQELCDAIDRLPPQLKRAHILHNVYGLKYESIDPEETTCASLMNVTGRTVQNYLEKAALELKRFSEEI